MVNATPLPLYQTERNPVPILQEADGPQGRSGLMRVNLAHTGIRIPEHLACSELLAHANRNCSRFFSILFLPLLPQFQVYSLQHPVLQQPRAEFADAHVNPPTHVSIRQRTSPFVATQITRSLSSRYVTSFTGIQSSRNTFRAL